MVAIRCPRRAGPAGNRTRNRRIRSPVHSCPDRVELVQIGPYCRGSGPNPLIRLPPKVCPKSAPDSVWSGQGHQYGGHDDRSSQHHRGRHRERPAHPRRHPPGHRPQLQAVRLAPITRPTQRRTIRRVVVPTTGRRDQMVSLPGHPPPTLTAPTAPPQPWPLHDLQPHRRRELEAQRRAARCDRTGHPLPGHPRPQEQQPGNQPAHPHGTNDTHGRLPRGHSAPPTRAARRTRSGSRL
jgi:hypothetical protein